MSVILCQANGDFAIINGQMWLTDNSVSSVPAVASAAPNPGQESLQLIRNILSMGQGEEDLDVSLGMPYLQQILGKGVQIETVEAIVEEQILAVPGVLDLFNLVVTLNAATRKLAVTFTAQTNNGPVDYSGTFP